MSPSQSCLNWFQRRRSPQTGPRAIEASPMLNTTITGFQVYFLIEGRADGDTAAAAYDGVVRVDAERRGRRCACCRPVLVESGRTGKISGQCAVQQEADTEFASRAALYAFLATSTVAPSQNSFMIFERDLSSSSSMARRPLARISPWLRWEPKIKSLMSSM